MHDYQKHLILSNGQTLTYTHIHMYIYKVNWPTHTDKARHWPQVNWPKYDHMMDIKLKGSRLAPSAWWPIKGWQRMRRRRTRRRRRLFGCLTTWLMQRIR